MKDERGSGAGGLRRGRSAVQFILHPSSFILERGWWGAGQGCYLGFMETSMRGQVCLVTGASAGIGKASARQLAERGATVVLVARSRERGEAAQAEIVRETGSGSVELLLADLASQGQIRALAADFRRRFERLDVLINNAAVFTRQRTLTEDGIETQFAVNHLAPFLLTNLLLEVLRASAPSRIVTVSSGAHRHARLDWDNLQGERGYSGLRAYGNAKLANLLFTLELARRLAGSGVTANAVHPGVIGTELLFSGWSPLRLLKPFLRKPADGARTVVYAAISPEVEGVSGEYFIDERSAVPAPQAQDPVAARRLWEISERLTGLAGCGAHDQVGDRQPATNDRQPEDHP
jgi:NAD(P)-dependent dehydrogenase (short-subunit alcohol dehydrogenase family)